MSSTALWISKFLLLTLFLESVFLHTANAGTLSCTVRASSCSGGETAIWRMSSTTNAHAELPSQSLYSQVICCTGVTGLSNACSGVFATALKLSGTTNAHIQQSGSYAQSACISVPSGGSVSVGYQATNCTGFDTTLGSMTGTTNAHVGNGTAYTTKICGTAAGAGASTVSCSTDISSTALGTLSASSISTASPNASTTMSCSGTASGCTLYVKDAGSGANPGLYKSVSPTKLIPSPNVAFNTTATLAAGTEGFGVQATTTSAGSGGTLTLSNRYNQIGNVVGGLSLTDLALASSTVDVTDREVITTHKAAISGNTLSGSYSDTITYSCIAN